jgi:alkanesulfonate monooxygenase
MMSETTTLVFHTVCPFHTGTFGSGRPLEPETYSDVLADHVNIASANGIAGMIIYNFVTSLDSFVVAQRILSLNTGLTPIIAVSPFHIHPYALARSFASIAYVTGRQAHLNLVKGATIDEQAAIGADYRTLSSHYRQMTEFLDVFNRLFADGKCDFDGEFFHLHGATLHPHPAEALRPGVFVPGSSIEAAELARGRATSSLLMAKPLTVQSVELERLGGKQPDLRHTVIVGVVARETEAKAWEAARSIYGGRRRDSVNARMFESRAISYQHLSNAELGREQEVYDGVLWCGASRAGIDCPKLVGSYGGVAAALAAYGGIGVTDVVVDLPATTSEYEHIFHAISLVSQP